MEHDENGYFVRDLDSTNGTAVNGRPASNSRLTHGDKVTFGTVAMEFLPYAGPVHAAAKRVPADRAVNGGGISGREKWKKGEHKEEGRTQGSPLRGLEWIAEHRARMM